MVLLLAFHLAGQGFHDQGRHFGRTDIGAVAATLAVQGIDLDSKFIGLHVLALAVHGDEALGSAFQLLVGGHNGDDGGMGADKGALVALDAVFRDPFRNINGHSSFFILGCSLFKDPVRCKHRDRKIVPALGIDFPHDLIHKGGGFFNGIFRADGILPGFGHLDFNEVVQGLVNRFNIH